MQVYIPEALFMQLKKTAYLREKPMSDLIREGLKLILPKTKKAGKKNPFEAFVGKCKLKEKTNAVDVINSIYK